MVSTAVCGSVMVPSPSLGVKGAFLMKAAVLAEFHSETAQPVTFPPAKRRQGKSVGFRHRVQAPCLASQYLKTVRQ